MSTPSRSTGQTLSFFYHNRAYLAWLAAAVFYFYQYILRVSPGIMIDDIRSAFSVKAEEFATLGSIYLLFYSLLQIPLGILVDKIGVKKTILASIVLCIAGAFLSSIAPNFIVMQISRAIIGTGSAAAFMASLKIVADSFAPGKRGFLMGATLTLGTVGALFSGKIVIVLLEDYNWQYIWQFAGALGLVILLFAYVAIPAAQEKKYSNASKSNHTEGTIHTILQILKDRNVILYSVLAVGLYTPLAALADLWGTAFLSVKFNLERGDAAQISMMLYLGMAIGSILLPWFCERRGILNAGIKWSAFIIFGIFTVILYGPSLSNWQLISSLIVIGIFCGSEMMCFTAALRYANEKNSGEVIGVVNTLNMLGGAVLQQIIGYCLDFNWDGTVNETGLRIYSQGDFVFALSSLAIVVFVCWLISLLLDNKQ